MGFCFPGQDHSGADLPPRRECAPLWHDALMVRLPDIALVLAIGRYAQNYHFRRLDLARYLGGSLSHTLQHWRDVWAAREAPKLLPLPHPSWRNTGWLKRNPWFEAELCRWSAPRCDGCWRASDLIVSGAIKGAFQDMAYSTIRCATDDGVALITLARPDKLNAINAAMHSELRTALDAARDDPAVRCVVLTGEGRHSPRARI